MCVLVSVVRRSWVYHITVEIMSTLHATFLVTWFFVLRNMPVFAAQENWEVENCLCYENDSCISVRSLETCCDFFAKYLPLPSI